jgi:hypothetical protein
LAGDVDHAAADRGVEVGITPAVLAIVVLLFSKEEETVARPASRVCRVLMTGPLAPFAEAYSAELKQRGYTPLTTVNQLRQVAQLSGWLQADGLSAADLSRERVERFLAWRRTAGCPSMAMSRPALLCLLEVLRDLGVLASEPPAPAGSPLDLLLASFERYLVSERGLAAGTIVGYVMHARWFLEGLGREGVTGPSAADVTGAVLRKASSGVSVCRRAAPGHELIDCGQRPAGDPHPRRALPPPRDVVYVDGRRVLTGRGRHVRQVTVRAVPGAARHRVRVYVSALRESGWPLRPPLRLSRWRERVTLDEGCPSVARAD